MLCSHESSVSAVDQRQLHVMVFGIPEISPGMVDSIVAAVEAS